MSKAVSGSAWTPGPPGIPGPDGPPGPGFTDIHTISETVSLPNTLGISLALGCDEGEVAIGGGATVTGQPDASLRTSEPVLLSDGTPVGWHVVGVQLTPATLTMDTYTICARRVTPPNTD